MATTIGHTMGWLANAISVLGADTVQKIQDHVEKNHAATPFKIVNLKKVGGDVYTQIELESGKKTRLVVSADGTIRIP